MKKKIEALWVILIPIPLLIIVFVWCICLKVDFFGKDFALHLLAGMVEVVLTVSIISSLLEIQKKMRIRKINKRVTGSIKSHIAYSGFNEILTACELKSGNTKAQLIGKKVFFFSNYDEDEVLRMFNDKTIREKILSKIEEKYCFFNEENGQFIEHISLAFKTLYDGLQLFLVKIEPYANPELEDQIIGFMLIGSVLKQYHETGKMYLNSQMGEPERQKIIQERINPALKQYFDATVKKFLINEFDLMLHLRQMADNNELAFDID